ISPFSRLPSPLPPPATAPTSLPAPPSISHRRFPSRSSPGPCPPISSTAPSTALPPSKGSDPSCLDLHFGTNLVLEKYQTKLFFGRRNQPPFSPILLFLC